MLQKLWHWILSLFGVKPQDGPPPTRPRTQDGPPPTPPR